MKPAIAKADWDRVHEHACEIVNAAMMDDEILGASMRERLFELLDDLDRKYGEHPSLLATRGDFSEDFRDAMKLFQRALELARKYEDAKEEAEILDSMANLRIG